MSNNQIQAWFIFRNTLIKTLFWSNKLIFDNLFKPDLVLKHILEYVKLTHTKSLLQDIN